MLVISFKFSQIVVQYTQHRASPWPNGKDSACGAGSARDTSSIPGSGRSPDRSLGQDGSLKEGPLEEGLLEEGMAPPLQYSCLENPMDRGAWWAPVHGVNRVGHD